MTLTAAALPSLDRGMMARFVRDGYIVVQTSLPAEFHAEVWHRAGEILGRVFR